MEEIDGIDVSWLHHAKSHTANKSDTANEPRTKTRGSSISSNRSRTNSTSSKHKYNNQLPQREIMVDQQSEGRTKPTEPGVEQKEYSSEMQPPRSPSKSKDSKNSSPGRKSSWMANLSSKITGGGNALSNRTFENGGSPSLKLTRTSSATKDSPGSNMDSRAKPTDKSINAEDARKQESEPNNVLQVPPHKRELGFLSSAMRRLSSSGSSSIGKQAGTGGICPRRTMNVNPYRERCTNPQLEQKKLRRVAFCVDVEIAGAAQYAEDNADESRPVSRDDLVAAGDIDTLQRRQTQKRGEGEALKQSAGNREDDRQIKLESAAALENAPSRLNQRALNEPDEANMKKKEKKKKAESGRKERKAKKLENARANGEIPVEINGESGLERNHTTSSIDGDCKNHRSPTTDPLRIYRRCCQLREQPIVRRIVEQIASPSAGPAPTPGVLTMLNLSGCKLELGNIVTLGDYLAVVPVRKIILDDCGLDDEALRIILSGLLAVKTSEQAKHNRKLFKRGAPSRTKDDAPEVERLGVIEKLSLKNNSRITADGWRHLIAFVYMSHSLKALDVSMIPFPSSIGTIWSEAVASRPAGAVLEELVLADCQLSTESVALTIPAIMQSGVSRLSLAGNHLDAAGFQNVLNFLRSGICKGLDIGGNDLRERMEDLACALDQTKECPLFAISLADCNLSPAPLERLLMALTRLPNVRFIDLSHNHDLFATKPSALTAIRRVLPRFKILKRLHLVDVSLTPEHAIALAETLPECKFLAHLNILENPKVAALADARTELAQEEACALYASVMAAVRVSSSIVCIDINVPSAESSEVVKALAKQAVAYSLRNMERLPLSDAIHGTATMIPQPLVDEKDVPVPDILLRLVGHVDGHSENHDNDESPPDDDYIVGGTGVVKALDICLKRATDSRKGSASLIQGPSPIASYGSMSQRTDAIGDDEVVKVQEGQGHRDGQDVRDAQGDQDDQESRDGHEKRDRHDRQGKAKEMSKNLLESARKIRKRLEPALLNEAKRGDELAYNRLRFLDSTLQGIIQRFEDEFPETRVAQATTSERDVSSSAMPVTPSSSPRVFAESPPQSPDPMDLDSRVGDADSLALAHSRPTLPSTLIRTTSSSHLSHLSQKTQKHAQEEALMHRFGQRLRREIFRPETQDFAHGTTGDEVEATHVSDLRRLLGEVAGTEIRESVARLGVEGVIRAIGLSAEDIKDVKDQGDGTVRDGEEQRIWRRRLEELERDPTGAEAKTCRQRLEDLEKSMVGGSKDVSE